jgi:hypothetical protein
MRAVIYAGYSSDLQREASDRGPDRGLPSCRSAGLDDCACPGRLTRTTISSRRGSGPHISPNPHREGRDPASGIEKAARIAWEMLVQTARKTVIARMKPEPKGAAAESAGRPVERVTFHNEENGSAFSEPRRAGIAIT